MTTAALAYHEPPITTILILSSFLLALTIINYIGNSLLYCGLIGQILVGVAWGRPGADWLSVAVQHAVMQLGYLGLILMVYEGGLSTNVKALRANLFLSALVAFIGISCPIALSFLLSEFLTVTPLQAFAAGAALCSTSLGTTFTVLSTSGLSESRLGVVLSSAAMMDDVIGLIMVQVVSNLGQTSSSFDAVTVVRPVLVSIAFAVVLPLVCVWVVKPLALLKFSSLNWIDRLMTPQQATFVLSTLALLAMVTGSSYAGTSNLFAAYLTGLTATWYDDLSGSEHHGVEAPRAEDSTSAPLELDEGPESSSASTPTTAQPVPSTKPAPPLEGSNDTSRHTRDDAEPTELIVRRPSSRASGPVLEIATTDRHKAEDRTVLDQSSPPLITAKTVYESYYAPAIEAILKPFFFASIGFSIPITQMFTGDIVWRGFVYAVLMTLGKLLCGVCLLRFNVSPPTLSTVRRLLPTKIASCWPWSNRKTRSSGTGTRPTPASAPEPPSTYPPTDPLKSTPRPTPNPSKSPKPLSLYPAAMLGTAMVARGEIGFLISSVAESTGIYGSGSGSGSSELFLVVTWAILICTILGPLTVGVLTKRVKRLQETERREGGGKRDPLGVWGVIAVC